MSGQNETGYIATAATEPQVRDLLKGEYLLGYPFPRVAFVGRSNVGKSSLINALVGRKKLAFVSQTPGKTKSIQFFLWKEKNLIVADLPGYGFAKVSVEERKRWDLLMAAYLGSDPKLSQIWLLWDSRVGPTSSDLETLGFFRQVRPEVSLGVVMTKADQLKNQSERSKRTRVVQEELEKHGLREIADVFWVSSESKVGIGPLIQRVGQRVEGVNLPA